MSSKQPAAPSSSATPHSGENSAPSSAESHRNAMAAGGVRERSFADTSAGQVTLVSDRREEGEGSAEAEPRGAIRQGVTPEKSLPNFGGRGRSCGPAAVFRTGLASVSAAKVTDRSAAIVV